MKALWISAGWLMAAAAGFGAEDSLDQVERALSFSRQDGRLRGHLSGSLELEFYNVSLPAPGLIDSSRHSFFNPRLALAFDAQLGSQLYFFTQLRIDQGFDPSISGREGRLDEYALRYTPWQDGRFNLQAGKFATVVGRWTERHLAWDNPFINAPMAYENVTPISDQEPPNSRQDFASTRIDAQSKYEYSPIVWGSCYATGIAVAGRLGQLDYAAEIKNAALSSRPEAWSLGDNGFNQPTFSGRLGFRPNAAWNLGFSASRGGYLRPEAAALLPAGQNLERQQQMVLAQDISFAWHHLQIWAEFFQARFDVPHVGHADTFAYFLEAKYKFTPQLFGAVRWNQQTFANVQNGEGVHVAWGINSWRIDASLGYRFTPHTQLKIQYDFGDAEYSHAGPSHLFAAQFTLRF